MQNEWLFYIIPLWIVLIVDYSITQSIHLCKYVSNT